MKQIVFLLILFSISVLISCEKKDDDLMQNDFHYEAIVQNKGFDCGETFIIELRTIRGNTKIADGIYYADNLDSKFKVAGLKINLNCREPNNNEVTACTTMGPTYPHVIIIDCKRVGE